MPKTITCRIAIAVCGDGSWCSVGDSAYHTESGKVGMALEALDCARLDKGIRVVFVDVEIELPTSLRIRGKAKRNLFADEIGELARRIEKGELTDAGT